MNYRDWNPSDSFLLAPITPASSRLESTSEVPTDHTTFPARTATHFGVFKRLAAVIALTLMLSAVLLSTTASPASARPRDLANAAIDDCFVSGGNPDAFYFGSTIIVTCVYYDGSWWWADFG